MKKNKGAGLQKRRDIDLGLAISGASLRPGQTRTLLEIAHFCGVTKQCISLIEQSAIRNLRKGLRERHITTFDRDI